MHVICGYQCTGVPYTLVQFMSVCNCDVGSVVSVTLSYHNNGFKTLFSVGIDCMRQCITRKTVGLVRVQYLVAIVELYRLEH